MSDALLEDFKRFFNDLPKSVRDDLTFMMVMLSDENLVVHDVAAACETAARPLFSSETRIGRFAELINAASIFDIYFAMDARRRFAPSRTRRTQSEPPAKAAGVTFILDRYACQVGEIGKVSRQWQELRRTAFAPCAIADALIPPGPSAPRTRGRRAAPSRREDERTNVSHDAISRA